MVLIPELPDPVIGKAAQHTGRRRDPIGRQNWFPNREYPDFRLRMLFQQFLDCGGPPQTDRSSRRKQKYYTNTVRGLVEVSLQRVEHVVRQFSQGRLTCGHLMAGEEVAGDQSEPYQRSDYKYHCHGATH